MNTVKKCIIIDDEPAAHYVLVNYIERNPQLELIQQFYNGVDAMAFLRENRIDLLFLDIDMPELTGLELLKILPSQPKTILTTAYSEFALESYEYGVIDYLLKPIYFPRFLKAIGRFLSMDIQDEAIQEQRINSISAKVDGYYIDIELDTLLYAQSFGNYVKLFTKNKTYLASTTTNELQNRLPENLFMRIHKSYIIALEKIDAIDKDILMVNSVKIPIGITYKRALSEVLKDRK